MVLMNGIYDGNKKCTLVHEEGGTIQTDAPKDIGGDASAFSPTDLVGASLGACILTTMGMFAERHGIDFKGTKVEVAKEMTTGSVRRIGSLTVKIILDSGKIPEDMRSTLERVGDTCPVNKSLHPDLLVSLEFIYR